MKKFYFYHLSSLVLGLSLTSNASANHIALLVGINDYPSPNQLEGAVNDVQAIKKTLIDKWQFSEKDIVTLINKD
ncbi:MAG TPA: caspase family protein, partial [Agitococcus sp.]|nr:caspase family protein [Agitococcus sp.]